MRKKKSEEWGEISAPPAESEEEGYQGLTCVASDIPHWMRRNQGVFYFCHLDSQELGARMK